MMVISVTMILTGIVLILNAFALVGHPVLMFIDLALAIYILWNSISKIDPPSVGPRNAFAGE